MPSDLDVIVVRKEGANQSHRDFQVRKRVVHDAFQWLITHNKYYRANHVCINTTALEQLPEVGNISDSDLTTITVESATDASANSTPPTNSPDETDSFNAHLAQSFVLVATQSRTEQEVFQESVRERKSSSSSNPSPVTLMWPFIPINEFTTEGYFSCAFLTLFPTGAGDFSGQR